jgi:hypothetical protein
MKRTFVVLTASLILLACVDPVSAQAVTLGDQDFANGAFPDNTVFDNASLGEPPAFDGFNGHDIFTSFSDTWTFIYSPQSVASATITLGLYDHDSAAPGDQVQTFTVDGNDLTALLNAALEATGGTQIEYNTYTINLPASAIPSLADGSATFSLALQGQGLAGVPGEVGNLSPQNGAGLDFATLTMNVPEPSCAIVLCMLAGSALHLRVPRARKTWPAKNVITRG